jgi:hypothetical protein
MEDASSIAEKVPLLGVASNQQATLKPGLTAKDESAQSDSIKEDNEKAKEKDGNEDASEDKKEDDIRIRTKDIGVWRIFYQDQSWSFLPGADLFRQFKAMGKSLPYFWRFTKEMWTIAPGYLLLFAFLRVWESVEGALSLWITAQLLNTVCLGL